MLDYANKQASFYEKYVDTPIEPVDWPNADDSLSFSIEMNVTEAIVYSGNYSVGESALGRQSNDIIAYDTRTTWTIIPSTDSRFGWFDPTGYDSAIDTSSQANITVGAFEGECYKFTTDVCVTTNSDDLCVS